MKASTNTPQRSRLAQSRIDYIVFGNPNPVKELVEKYGYEAPRKLEELSLVVRELIKEEGKVVVTELVKLHPDLSAIMTVMSADNGDQKKEPVKEEPKPENKKEDDKKTEKESTKCTNCGNRLSSEDNYCGCSHNYNYDEKSNNTLSSKSNLSSLTQDELMQRYEILSKQSAASPHNKALSEEATQVWNEIRLRNQAQPKTLLKTETIFAVSAAVIIATIGVLIGVSLRSMRNHPLQPYQR